MGLEYLQMKVFSPPNVSGPKSEEDAALLFTTQTLAAHNLVKSIILSKDILLSGICTYVTSNQQSQMRSPRVLTLC